ncbi:unnamed protein product [Cylicocyclus nassatus]|uniref:G-protein coupled receptors family 1 profile domain-containing protein n=1 Tax=Cylicocyclus nassatus TaxID=53992 RepID=A0AA36H2D2_CYLNA|nr:unnamed protein product [Cylicocyclus nassatus]
MDQHTKKINPQQVGHFAWHQRSESHNLPSVRDCKCGLYTFWYRIIRTTPYIVTVMVLCSSYSLPVAVWGWINMNDDVIPFCNPPLGLAPRVSRFWSSSNVVISALVVVVYALIIGFIAANAKSRTCADQRKVIRRLQVVMIVFICSWFTALLGVDMAVWFDFPPDITPIWQSNMIIFALICYSQTFYVCIWRSPEYRLAFKEQLRYMACRKPMRLCSESTKNPSTIDVR